MSISLEMDCKIQKAVHTIQAQVGDFQPDIGLVLGSGLGDLALMLSDTVIIPYVELDGFPNLTVEGHAGRLVLGVLGKRRVAILQGRVHAYETGDVDCMSVPIGVLAKLGCKDLIVTNSAGSLQPDVGPGNVMMISDHINLTGHNPLIGTSGNDRFVDMVNAYDANFRAQFRAIAKAQNVALAEGVYMWFVGPTFETPSEIRAAKMLGADAVGMSTVPEVILARSLGLRVAAFSLVTNLAAGMGTSPLSHARTLARAANGAVYLKKLLLSYMEESA